VQFFAPRGMSISRSGVMCNKVARLQNGEDFRPSVRPFVCLYVCLSVCHTAVPVSVGPVPM